MDRQLIEPTVIFILVVVLAFLAQGCTQRSQSGEEQNAVARHCQMKDMNVVLGYRGFPWGGLEYAECVKPPAGGGARERARRLARMEK